MYISCKLCTYRLAVKILANSHKSKALHHNIACAVCLNKPTYNSALVDSHNSSDRFKNFLILNR